jgi:protein-export membrane protein SecD
MSLLQATLTLPGIAGIVLTLGMSVDANVLIYERIREEMRQGKTAISAIDTGFRRAMSAIVDSNITTILAALILFQLGSGPVRGFAVTLGLGIIISFFSAVMVTRVMIVLWMRRAKPKSINL